MPSLCLPLALRSYVPRLSSSGILSIRLAPPPYPPSEAASTAAAAAAAYSSNSALEVCRLCGGADAKLASALFGAYDRDSAAPFPSADTSVDIAECDERERGGRSRSGLALLLSGSAFASNRSL